MTVRFSTSPPEVRTRWSCAGDHRRRYEVICHFSGSRVLSKQTNHRRMTKQSPDLVTSLLTWFTNIHMETWTKLAAWSRWAAAYVQHIRSDLLFLSRCWSLLSGSWHYPSSSSWYWPYSGFWQSWHWPSSESWYWPYSGSWHWPSSGSWHLSPSSDPGDGRAPTERWLVWAVYTSAPLYTCSGHSALQHPAPRQRNRATSWLNDAKMMQ